MDETEVRRIVQEELKKWDHNVCTCMNQKSQSLVPLRTVDDMIYSSPVKKKPQVTKDEHYQKKKENGIV